MDDISKEQEFSDLLRPLLRTYFPSPCAFALVIVHRPEGKADDTVEVFGHGASENVARVLRAGLESMQCPQSKEFRLPAPKTH